MTSSLQRLALIGLGTGVAGWLLENVALGRPRYSVAFGEHKVPFLPAYAAGGVAIALLAPHLQKENVLVRAAAYGVGLSGVELVAGGIDREIMGPNRMTWAYGPDKSVIDLQHTLLWALLGLAAEQVIERVP